MLVPQQIVALDGPIIALLNIFLPENGRKTETMISHAQQDANTQD
jgi:hypothetical protein